MIGLSRLKRAISDVPPGGMQTGDHKVKLKLCDAQRIEVEYAALIAERDAALAQNAELVAQVGKLKQSLISVRARENLLHTITIGLFQGGELNGSDWDYISEDQVKEIEETLRQIQADAILSAIKFFKGSRDIDVEALESYANRVKAGEV